MKPISSYCDTLARIALSIVLLVAGLCVLPILAQAQVTENVDPTVAQFPIVNRAGDPNYHGALDISIPLMTVPGIQGLDYHINLQYIDGNGVPISRSSSWVGLGWNLQNYEITCNPVSGPYGASSYWYDTSSYAPDLYHLYYPGGSTTFWMDASGKGIPVRWSGIKIVGIKDGSTSEYKCFVVYGLDGTKYVFADRLRKQTNGGLINQTLLWPASPDLAYYYVFKLSAILAPDYVDGGGNWYLPGDGGTDKGAWIKLQYSSPSEAYTGNSTDMAQEVDYLDSVETPVFTADFVLGENNPFIIDHNLAQGSLSSLSKILMYRNGQSEPVKIVDFFQSHYFNWLSDDADSYLWESDSDTTELRTRLDSVRIMGENGESSEPTYKFSYYQGGIDFINTPYYIDNWGYLTSEWNQSFPDSSDYYTYGMIKQITYPTGGTDQFFYGPNYFQPNKACSMGTNDTLQSFRADSNSAVMQGGLRIEKQIITDPQTGDQQIFTYRYGDSNTYMSQAYAAAGLSYPGVGFVSDDPGPTGNLSTLDYIGGNLNQQVGYSDITIELPDGSKIVKCYTSSCTDVALSQGNEYRWMFYDSNNLPRIVFQNDDYGWPNFEVAGMFDYFPYVYSPDAGSDYYSYLTIDFPWITFPCTPGKFVTGALCPDGAGDVDSLALCEAYKFDNCAINALVSFQFDGAGYNVSGFLKTMGIDNSWKRGYLLKEEKYSKADSLVWSKSYYYNMILKNAQDYTVIDNSSTVTQVHFTECSGQVRLTKTIERRY